MRVRDWVHALAERLGISEDRLLRAFILEVLSLPNWQLVRLMVLDPREPGALTEPQADIIVGCLERAAETVSKARKRIVH